MPGNLSLPKKTSRPRPRPTSASSMVWTNPFGNSTSVYPKNIITEGSFGVSTSKGRPVGDIIAAILPQLPPLGALRFGIRHRNRRTHRRTFGRAQEQLGRLDLHGRGHDRYLRSFLHHRSSFANLRRRSPSGPEGGRLGQPQGVLLPAFTLGLVSAAYLARLSRGGILEVLSQDFVRTAHAKGVSPTKVILKHTLRGGLLPQLPTWARLSPP